MAQTYKGLKKKTAITKYMLKKISRKPNRNE
jgi:hypothetical protein